MKIWKFVSVVLVVFAATTAARAAPIPVPTLFNTGVDAAGVVLANNLGDPHWTISSVPSGSNADRTVTSAGGFPVGPWLGDNTTSAWIRPNNNPSSPTDNDPVGNYTFQTTFDMTGFDKNTAVIVGRWASDNVGTNIKVNGVSTNQTSLLFTQWTSFVILSSLLNPGLNTLEFLVNNAAGSSGNPAGLRVEFTSEAIATPLPSTWLMLLTGFAAFGFLTYRGARKNAASVAAA